MSEVNTEPAPEVTEPTTNNNEPTVEDLMVQIQKLKADNASLQTKNDKLSSESGGLRKQLREKMTAEEAEVAAKQEQEAQREAEIQAILRENKVLKEQSRYINMGFDEELARATAEAAADGDQETVNANYAKYMESWKKETEANLKAELLKNMPEPHSGNGSGEINYTQQKNDALANKDMHSYIAAENARWRSESQNS